MSDIELMKPQANTLGEQNAIREVIEALKGTIGRFANDDGVQVLYHKVQRSRVMFRFRTPDNIGMDIDFDLNELSEDYVYNMIDAMRDKLFEVRKARHNNPIIINTGSK